MVSVFTKRVGLDGSVGGEGEGGRSGNGNGSGRGLPREKWLRLEIVLSC